MKQLFVLSAILMPCAMAKAEEPTFEWMLRIMERTIPEGTDETFKSAADYNKYRNNFKEKVSITIYTNGFRTGIAKSSSGIGTLSFAIYPLKNDGEDCMIINFVFRKRPVVTGYRLSQSKLLHSNGKEFVIVSGSGATPDRKRPGRLLNIKSSVLVLTVKKMKSNIAQLAKDSANEDSAPNLGGVQPPRGHLLPPSKK